MQTSNKSIPKNEVGNVLAHLRVDYCESIKAQAERLDVDSAYLYMITRGKRPFTITLYKSIIEHYSTITEEHKKILIDAVVKPDVQKRFLEYFPEGTIEQLFYILYGDVEE